VIDLDNVPAAAQAKLGVLLLKNLPRGQFTFGGRYSSPSPKADKKRQRDHASDIIVLGDGRWIDHATEQQGDDVIGLLGYLQGRTKHAVTADLARTLHPGDLLAGQIVPSGSSTSNRFQEATRDSKRLTDALIKVVSTADGDAVLWAPFTKIDGERREVYGYATTPTRDASGESVSLDAVRNALPEYLRFPSVREMHSPSAVGTGIEARIDDRGLWFGAHISDDQAWRKVQQKTYRGFSVGGRVTKRDPRDPKHILGIELHEISLVDRPCNPDASFEVVKRDGSGNPVIQHSASPMKPSPE
jgi:hypothetical protein